MRVAIVGSRDYPVLKEVGRYVGRIASKYPDALIVSGGARGVDLAAEGAAEYYDLRVKSFRPFESARGDFGISIYENYDSDDPFECIPDRFDSYGKAAYFRNGLIVENAAIVVAFTTGSRGTQHTIDLARAAGKPTFVYNERGEVA